MVDKFSRSIVASRKIIAVLPADARVAAEALAVIDVATALAQLAVERHYVRPQIDASLDCTTNVPYTIKQAGPEAMSFLLYDFGFTIFNDTVVVTEDTLKAKRKELDDKDRTTFAGLPTGSAINRCSAAPVPDAFTSAGISGVKIEMTEDRGWTSSQTHGHRMARRIPTVVSRIAWKGP